MITIKDLVLLAPDDISYVIFRYGDDFNQKVKFSEVSKLSARFLSAPIVEFDIKIDKYRRRYLWVYSNAFGY